MDTQQINESVHRFEGVLVVTPGYGSQFPELSWGDSYLYYAPDGVKPERTQPYGTIITKDYPGDESSRLDEPGRFRVNVHISRDRAAALTRAEDDPAERSPSAAGESNSGAVRFRRVVSPVFRPIQLAPRATVPAAPATAFPA